jgi:hypothetical protein
VVVKVNADKEWQCTLYSAKHYKNAGADGLWNVLRWRGCISWAKDRNLPRYIRQKNILNRGLGT